MLASENLASLWRFFNSVSAAVAQRMLAGSSPGEENLTFLLCELLDESSTALHVLEYPLSEVRAALASSDSGVTVDVSFTTHEHSKHVESRFSGADLGIVLEIRDPILGSSRRGVLIQAKRLFPHNPSARFTLHSRYQSFEPQQRDFLKTISDRFGVYNSVFYLWYNPSSSAFEEDDARRLRSYEARTRSASHWFGMRGRFHPFLDELLDSGLPLLAAATSTSTTGNDEALRMWRASQPALRVSGLDSVAAVTEGGVVPGLTDMYHALIREPGRWSPGSAFAPFADFFLLAFLGDRIGGSKPEWLRLVEGNKVPLPAADAGRPTGPAANVPDVVPAPRHTLVITVRSTIELQ